MRKTIAILVIVTLLGIVAAYEVPAGGKKTTASTTTSTTTQTTPSTSQSSSSSTATTPTATTTSATYKDGTYTGSTATNMYEDIQVAVTVSGGKITNVTTPVVNSDSGHSEQINNYAIPQLNQQVISNQNAQIDGVSGASYTTQSYTQSLQAALDQAKA